MRRKHLDLVGAYCERFINWGCEDSDLQWKLGERFSLQFIPNEARFEVIHLDHPKLYFSKEAWKRNEAIADCRKRQGAYISIAQDMAKNYGLK